MQSLTDVAHGTGVAPPAIAFVTHSIQRTTFPNLAHVRVARIRLLVLGTPWHHLVFGRNGREINQAIVDPHLLQTPCD